MEPLAHPRSNLSSLLNSQFCKVFSLLFPSFFSTSQLSCYSHQLYLSSNSLSIQLLFPQFSHSLSSNILFDSNRNNTTPKAPCVSFDSLFYHLIKFPPASAVSSLKLHFPLTLHLRKQCCQADYQTCRLKS